MSALPRQLQWKDAQTKWAQAIDPVLNSAILQNNILTDIKLINGVTVINHLLQRMPKGYIIIDQNAAASIYRSAPNTNLTISLTSNTAVTVSLLVF